MSNIEDQAIVLADFHGFIQTLTPWQMSVLLMLLDGDTPVEIAEQFGISRNAVKLRIRGMRRKMAAYYEFEPPKVRRGKRVKKGRTRDENSGAAGPCACAAGPDLAGERRAVVQPD